METRTLLCAAIASDPNDVPDILDPDLLPDLLGAGHHASATGSIVNRADGSGDVDWYRFDLSSPTTISLVLRPTPGAPLSGVLSLYNTAERYDPIFGVGDPSETIGHRQLEQAVGTTDTPAQIVRDLAPGTYYIAVSGAGNLYFHPFVPCSGYPGSVGDYTVEITTTDLAPGSGGAAVLAVDPAPGAVLDRSPLVFRVSLDGSLSPTQLIELRDGANQRIDPSWTNYSTLGREFQFGTPRALQPGAYTIVLIDTAMSTEIVVSAFEIGGVEGNLDPAANADDHRKDPPGEPGGAHELGDLLSLGLVQRVGAVGDDPSYDPLWDDSAGVPPLLSNRAADVDLYHFEITGPGTYGLLAEVFAGRIGSPLDAGLSLFRLNDLGELELVAVNDNTFNPTLTANGTLPLPTRPLFNDSLLFAGLTAGHYYLAVSSSGPIGGANVPDPIHGLLPGSNGIFTPNISHSGVLGTTLGTYVLNVEVFADDTPPQVIASTPSANELLVGSPAQIVVRFNEAVNLPMLANLAFQATFPFPPGVAAAYLTDLSGRIYYLRLDTYDPLTNEAVFLVPEHLADGAYDLHLIGVTDLAGNPLEGSVGGDLVISFAVLDLSPGSGPQIQPEAEPNDDPFLAQPLGVASPGGVGVLGDLATSDPFDLLDTFTVDVADTNTYLFALWAPSGAPLPAGLFFVVTDLFGSPVAGPTNQVGGGMVTIANALVPGSYLVMIGFLDPQQAVAVSYQLLVTQTFMPENPPPLTSGPAPALGLRLATRIQPPPQPPIAPPPPPRVVINDLPPPVTPAGTGNNPFEFFTTLPPGSLAFLAAGPLGGVGGTNATEALVLADRLQLGTIESSLLAGLVRLTLLTPTPTGAEDGELLEKLRILLERSLDLMEKSLGQFLDGFLGVGGWLRPMANPPADDTSDPQEAAVEPLPEVPDEPQAWEIEVIEESAGEEWAEWYPQWEWQTEAIGAEVDSLWSDLPSELHEPDPAGCASALAVALLPALAPRARDAVQNGGRKRVRNRRPGFVPTQDLEA